MICSRTNWHYWSCICLWGSKQSRMPAEIDNETQHLEAPRPEFIFGTTAGMRQIRATVERAAQDNLPVLIQGESGTGKEMLSQYLHRQRGGGGPFLKLNCGAAPASLVEGEIYGIERTTAKQSRENKGGLIELASGGTLFLDEIEGMDISLQRRVAHTLETRRYRRIEGKEDLTVDARLVCATSIDLEAELRNCVVEELLGRLVHRVRLLPLRERREDMPQLCEFCWRSLRVTLAVRSLILAHALWRRSSSGNGQAIFANWRIGLRES